MLRYIQVSCMCTYCKVSQGVAVLHSVAGFPVHAPVLECCRVLQCFAFC